MYITLTRENIEAEHICCAFSDKKCAEGYRQKKRWLAEEFDKGYVFRRLDERAKVFIEYGPAETAWIPVTAPNYLMLGCFWVSGKYKGHGHGKALFKEAVKAAKIQGRNGFVSVAGMKKFHFMSDTKWLLGQGFEIRESLPSGFCLLSLDFGAPREIPHFKDCVKNESIPERSGCVVYYSNRCPYAEYHVRESLAATCRKRNVPLKIVKLESLEQAQAAPTPATIFSLFYEGKFVTTDISVCMDAKFDKILEKYHA